MRTKEYYATPYGEEGLVSVRRIARHAALTALAVSYKLTGRMSSLKRNRVQFVYLHHIFEEEVTGFRRLLRFLSRSHSFISYSEAVERVRRGEIDRPYVCVSFDDGLKNCLRAARVMDEFGVSGCFFICPSIIGETDRQKLKEFCVRKLALPATDMLTWNDVETLIKTGHEIGSHTMSHPVLSRIPQDRAQHEIGQSYEILTRRVGAVKHFAWPEGRFFHFNPAAARSVFAAGFQSCASAERGCHVTRPEPNPTGLCIRRDYIAAKWPLSHAAYFLASNSRTASEKSNLWPEGWCGL